ncbi:MAG: SDR family oxidoreductase [Solirubrobacteraceae bacterium]|nr:SDR family oxidoreductase [Solirubrobacteraceae bacterium]
MAKGTTVVGRTAVITGAGSGIGRALALRLARAGSPVALVDRDEEGLETTVEQIDGPVLHRVVDVSDRQAQHAFAADVDAWAPQPIGVVVNNAGVTVSQPVAGSAIEDDEWVMNVNYWGVVHGTQAFLPILKRQDAGAIVNVSSVFGLFAWPTQSAYCASKFAVRGFTEALRHELRGTGVRAIAVHPGGIDTNIVRNARFHADDRGSTDRSVLEQEFSKVARTSPEKAAATIQRGVERGESRILVGADAHLVANLVRIAPVRYFSVIKALEPLVRR